MGRMPSIGAYRAEKGQPTSGVRNRQERGNLGAENQSQKLHQDPSSLPTPATPEEISQSLLDSPQATLFIKEQGAPNLLQDFKTPGGWQAYVPDHLEGREQNFLTEGTHSQLIGFGEEI